MQSLTTIYDFLYTKFLIKKPVRLIELFAGYGSQALSLHYLGVDFEHWFVCDNEKVAIDAYNVIHNTNFTTTDICKVKADDLRIVDADKYTYIMTYSFPCQDLSSAGLQKGMARNGGTRSGLLWEVERILKECKELPQVLIMENVPALLCCKNIKDFQEWEMFLSNLGYSNYVKIINSKDFMIPQSRSRCFMVSILGGYNYVFPNEIKSSVCLLDILDKNVGSKYFLSDAVFNQIIFTHTTSFMPSISAPDKLYIKNTSKKGYTIAENGDGVDFCQRHHSGCVQKGTSFTLRTSPHSGVCVYDERKSKLFTNNSVRIFTPRESFRLMGVLDLDSNKLAISDSRKYFLAGNSIVTTVLMGIFGTMFNVDYEARIKFIFNHLVDS